MQITKIFLFSARRSVILSPALYYLREALKLHKAIADDFTHVLPVFTQISRLFTLRFAHPYAKIKKNESEASDVC